MIKALQSIRMNGKRYQPGDELPALNDAIAADLVAAGAIVVTVEPTPEPEPKKTRKPKADGSNSDG